MFYWFINEAIQDAAIFTQSAYSSGNNGSIRKSGDYYNEIGNLIVNYLLSKPLPDEETAYYTAQAWYCYYEYSSCLYAFYMRSRKYNKAVTSRRNATAYISEACETAVRNVESLHDMRYYLRPYLPSWGYYRVISLILEDYPEARKLYDESDYKSSLVLFIIITARIKRLLEAFGSGSEEEFYIEDFKDAVVNYVDMLYWQSAAMFDIFLENMSLDEEEGFSAGEFMQKLGEIYNEAYLFRQTADENNIWEYLEWRIEAIEENTINVLSTFADNFASIKPFFAKDPVMLSLINSLPTI